MWNLKKNTTSEYNKKETDTHIGNKPVVTSVCGIAGSMECKTGSRMYWTTWEYSQYFVVTVNGVFTLKI